MVAGSVQSELIEVAVNFKSTKPFAISFSEGVKVGVSVVSFGKYPGVPESPVTFVHNKLVLLETVTKSGNVNVSPHIEILFVVATIDAFL